MNSIKRVVNYLSVFVLPAFALALLFTIAVLVNLSMIYIFDDQDLRADADCQPDSIQNEVVEKVARTKFWVGQISALNKEIAYLESLPESMAQIDSDSEKLEQELTKVAEKVYREKPELRPTQSQQSASLLRAKADAIEDAERYRILEIGRQARLTQLQSCRSQVAGRLRG